MIYRSFGCLRVILIGPAEGLGTPINGASEGAAGGLRKHATGRLRSLVVRESGWNYRGCNRVISRKGPFKHPTGRTAYGTQRTPGVSESEFC